MTKGRWCFSFCWGTRAACLVVLVAALASCTAKKAELGSADNPVKLFLVPSVDAKTLEDQSKRLKTLLESMTPYHYTVSIPASYITVVEAFGTKRADVASLNTFGYVMAHEKYGVEAVLTVLRFGQPDYQAQIIARSDGPIKTLADINGKKFAYVDSASTSGYVLPLKLLNDKHIVPKETVFAQKHDNVVSMVYQKQVDAGATFYSPPEDGKIQDARRLVTTQYPDVEQKIKIVELTEAVPNDPIVLRKDIPAEMKTAIVTAITKLMERPEGRDIFYQMYGATGFKRAADADYEKVRMMLKAIGQGTSGSSHEP